MSEPARFLTALSQALASTGLYGPAPVSYTHLTLPTNSRV